MLSRRYSAPRTTACEGLKVRRVHRGRHSRVKPGGIYDYCHSLEDVCFPYVIACAERDGTRAETRFRLSPKRTSPFKSVGASVQSTAGSRGVRISLSNSG